MHHQQRQQFWHTLLHLLQQWHLQYLLLHQ
jgi:hypothetical protein